MHSGNHQITNRNVDRLQKASSVFTNLNNLHFSSKFKDIGNKYQSLSPASAARRLDLFACLRVCKGTTIEI